MKTLNDLKFRLTEEWDQTWGWYRRWLVYTFSQNPRTIAHSALGAILAAFVIGLVL